MQASIVSIAMAAKLVVSLVTWIIYALFFHPLSSFPGPKLWAVTQLPWHQNNVRGRLAFRLNQIHVQYGSIIRIGPNELSFAPTSGEAWKIIYGHRPEMARWHGGTGLPGAQGGFADIIDADEQTHARMRKAMSPAFSERALRDQEEMLILYVDKLMTKLREAASKGPLDILKFFNWTTFDIIGELTFGESFEGLDKLRFHPWVATFLDNIKAIAVGNVVVSFHLHSVLEALMPKKLKDARDEFWAFGDRKIGARLKLEERGEGKDKNDLVRFMMANVDPGAEMSRRELGKNAAVLVFAGSETSATFCSGAVYLMLTNPKAYLNLCDEIRGAFKKVDDVNMVTVGQLEYLNCVVQEVFRMYPPAPATLPRIVPAGGESIEGFWIPQGTIVGINQYSTYQSSRNFHNPKKFDPRRWLADEKRPAEYGDDNRSVLQPFSTGQRNCLGQNLANVEIRLILCRLLLEFDLKLMEESKAHWLDQEVYTIWGKKPLLVTLHPRDF